MKKHEKNTKDMKKKHGSCFWVVQLELAITQRFEVEMGRPGGRWKAESQGFPTSTIRASEDITSSSYGRFEFVPPPAEIH